jgi:hypothetical protein
MTCGGDLGRQEDAKRRPVALSRIDQAQPWPASSIRTRTLWPQMRPR